jgi:protein-S-isoprenylcysteine O-methyltransferase Ste14
MEKMSRFGVGRKINLCFVTSTALFGSLRYFFPSYFSLFGMHGYLKPVAMLMISLGVALWLSSVFYVMRAYNNNTPCTNGPFKLCRHPVYGSWAVLILPGIFLLANTWLAVPLAMVLAYITKKLGASEDEYLRTRFGSIYEDYRKRTPAVFPFGKLINPS